MIFDTQVEQNEEPSTYLKSGGHRESEMAPDRISPGRNWDKGANRKGSNYWSQTKATRAAARVASMSVVIPCKEDGKQVKPDWSDSNAGDDVARTGLNGRANVPEDGRAKRWAESAQDCGPMTTGFSVKPVGPKINASGNSAPSETRTERAGKELPMDAPGSGTAVNTGSTGQKKSLLGDYHGPMMTGLSAKPVSPKINTTWNKNNPRTTSLPQPTYDGYDTRSKKHKQDQKRLELKYLRALMGPHPDDPHELHWHEYEDEQGFYHPYACTCETENVPASVPAFIGSTPDEEAQHGFRLVNKTTTVPASIPASVPASVVPTPDEITSVPDPTVRNAENTQLGPTTENVPASVPASDGLTPDEITSAMAKSPASTSDELPPVKIMSVTVELALVPSADVLPGTSPPEGLLLHPVVPPKHVPPSCPKGINSGNKQPVNQITGVSAAASSGLIADETKRVTVKRNRLPPDKATTVTDKYGGPAPGRLRTANPTARQSTLGQSRGGHRLLQQKWTARAAMKGILPQLQLILRALPILLLLGSGPGPPIISAKLQGLFATQYHERPGLTHIIQQPATEKWEQPPDASPRPPEHEPETRDGIEQEGPGTHITSQHKKMQHLSDTQRVPRGSDKDEADQLVITHAHTHSFNFSTSNCNVIVFNFVYVRQDKSVARKTISCLDDSLGKLS